jgi:hypothetical protein
MNAFLLKLTRCSAAAVVLALVLSLAPVRVLGADSLDWRTNQVTADIRGWPVIKLLEHVAGTTGWRIYLEPDATHTVSTKFKDLPPGEALRRLLGDLNFALVPETNASPKLFVFRTVQANATQAVRPIAGAKAAAGGKVIPNELIVRLKPGAKIEDLARQLGAKVIGQIAGLNAYRLQFADEEAATAARQSLASNSDVAAVDSNYSIDRPNLPSQVAMGNVPPPPQLQLRPPGDTGRVVVGLVDTAVQPLGNNLDQFLLKQQSVAGDPQLDPSSPAHGTSMAETMLRSLQTITKGNTSVQILPVDVYGPNPSTTTFDVASGITVAVNQGANPINLSLGSTGDSQFLHDLIKQATDKGILFVGAAGNEHVPTPFYPGAYPEVNGVTAIDNGTIASYANYDPSISLGAPGTTIVYFNNVAYQVVGTSASSAFISGMAAGYMDTTHSKAAQAQTFIHNNFGIKIQPAK